MRDLVDKTIWKKASEWPPGKYWTKNMRFAAMCQICSCFLISSPESSSTEYLFYLLIQWVCTYLQMAPDMLHEEGRRRWRSVKAKPTHAADVSVIYFLVSTLSLVAVLTMFYMDLDGDGGDSGHVTHFGVFIVCGITSPPVVGRTAAVLQDNAMVYTLVREVFLTKQNENHHLSCARRVSSFSSFH